VQRNVKNRKSRKKRRRKVGVTIFVLWLVIVAAIIYWKAFFAFGVINLNDNVVVNYAGYNTKGSLTAELNKAQIDEAIQKAYEKSDESIIHLNKKYTLSDYEALCDSIILQKDKSENLQNGDQINITFAYNEELAKTLKVKIKAEDSILTVADLPEAKLIDKEELFKQVEVRFSGVSPEVKLEIVNNSTDPFIKNVLFSATPAQMYYSAGDEITITASWNEENAIAQSYCVATGMSDCYKTYTVGGMEQYIMQTDQLSLEFVKKVNDYAKTLFTDASEYGMRIFSEAYTEAKWESGEAAVFSWSEPVLISSYFKSIKPEALGETGLDYNELDLIYHARISQPSGGTCDAEAVVRISNMMLNADGIFVADIENARIVSASHNNNSIVKNVITSYEDKYNVEKLEISEYY